MNKDKCPMDPYTIIPEKSIMIDQQSLKLQESPENVPTWEIPRTFQICVDRNLTNKLVPGSRLVITGKGFWVNERGLLDLLVKGGQCADFWDYWIENSVYKRVGI